VLEPALSAVPDFRRRDVSRRAFFASAGDGQRTLDPFIEWLIAGAIVWRELPCLQRSISPPRPLPASPKLSLADSAKIKDKFPFGHLPARN
jgi:hypothetical protein